MGAALRIGNGKLRDELRIHLLEVGGHVRGGILLFRGGHPDTRQRVVGAGHGEGEYRADIRGGGVALGQRREIPAALDGFEDCGVIQWHGAIGHPKNRPGLDAGRDQHGGNAHAETGEVEPVFADRMVGRHRPPRRRHMVVAAAVFIVGDDQQRLVPRWSVAQGIVDVMDELFSERNVVIGVLAVTGAIPTGLQESKGRQ